LATWRARMPRSATTTSGYCGGPPQWPDVILRTPPGRSSALSWHAGRKAAGFSSQDALAARLGFDRTVVAKGETGDRPPSDEVLDAWCEACGLDRELFGRWAAFARRTDGPIPSWFESWLEAERVAHALRLWSPILIPGLLQTAEYARELFVAAGEDDERAEELVAARMDRQAILDRVRPQPATWGTSSGARPSSAVRARVSARASSSSLIWSGGPGSRPTAAITITR
jgi:transcriptional regulator with XRE-family HTH domain